MLGMQLMLLMLLQLYQYNVDAVEDVTAWVVAVVTDVDYTSLSLCCYQSRWAAALDDALVDEDILMSEKLIDGDNATFYLINVTTDDDKYR